MPPLRGWSVEACLRGLESWHYRDGPAGRLRSISTSTSTSTAAGGSARSTRPAPRTLHMGTCACGGTDECVRRYVGTSEPLASRGRLSPHKSSGWAEEVPGFAVGVVEAGAAITVAAEQEAGDSASGVQRNDVPGVSGNDVDGEEVDFSGEIRDGASAGAAVGVDAVEAFEELGGALYLDAPEGR